MKGSSERQLVLRENVRKIRVAPKTENGLMFKQLRDGKAAIVQVTFKAMGEDMEALDKAMAVLMEL